MLNGSRMEWVTVQRKGMPGVSFMAHPVPDGWRYGELTDERFPKWVTVTAEQFQREFEMVPLTGRAVSTRRPSK